MQDGILAWAGIFFGGGIGTLITQEIINRVRTARGKRESAEARLQQWRECAYQGRTEYLKMGGDPDKLLPLPE